MLGSIKTNVKKITKISLLIIILIFIILTILTAFKLFVFGSKHIQNKPPDYLFSITNSSKLTSPFGVSFSPGGYLDQDKIFVADSGSNRIKVFNSKGEILNSFSFIVSKTKNMKPHLPVGITVDDEKNIYVSETNTPYIYVFNSQGKFLSTFPKKNEPFLMKPVGLSYVNEKLYVTDIGDQKIKVFNKKGKLLLEFGKEGTTPGEFSFPIGVTADNNGRIYVADTGNKRLQVFNPKGKIIKSISNFHRSRMNLPRGVAVDSLGQVHVVDSSANNVLVFSGSLKYLYSYGKLDNGNKTLSYPNAIAIDKKSNRVFITEQLNKRLSVWGY